MPAKTTPELTVDGVRLVTLCADITVYWRGSMLDRAEGILAFYERALKLIGDSVCWYETETMGDVEAIHGKVFDMLPFWLRNPKARRGIQALGAGDGELVVDPTVRGVPQPCVAILSRYEDGSRAGDAGEVLQPPRIDFANRHLFRSRTWWTLTYSRQPVTLDGVRTDAEVSCRN